MINDLAIERKPDPASKMNPADRKQIDADDGPLHGIDRVRIESAVIAANILEQRSALFLAMHCGVLKAEGI